MARRIALARLSGGCLFLLPLTGVGQQATKLHRVGVLWHAESREGEGPIFEAFMAGLLERGYVDGRNIALEHRFAAEIPERFGILAAELVALKPDLLVGVSTFSAVALKKTGTSIPILFTEVGDALGSGLVGSYTAHDRNTTGFTTLSPDISKKRLQLLTEIVPGLRRVGVLHNPSSPSSQPILREIAEATQALELTPQLVEARTPAEIDDAFAQFSRSGIKAALIASDAMFLRERNRIANAAIAAGIAETQFTRDGVEAGSLFSYGPNLPDVARQTSSYVERILRGTAPGDLPVVQPTRFELVINLRTARTLRLMIPQTLLLRADQVIE
jgi:putative ABC transport system substrate-binding protein